jgi:outer membrane murein-binding lipoprotein Lpp
MFNTHRALAAAVIACAIGMSSGAVRGDEPAASSGSSGEQLQQKIDQLEAKVQTLETKQSRNQADVTAAIQQVLADADHHSQLMDNMAGDSGYDSVNGFHLGNPDGGGAYIHPWMLFQFRAVGNNRSSVSAATGTGADVPQTGSNSQTGFEIRELKFGLDGSIYNPLLHYYLQIDVPRSGGGLTLDDAYVTYRLGNDSPWTLKAGQFEDIAWHETNVDEAHTLTAERSLVSALIGGSIPGFGSTTARVQGFDVQWQQGAIRAEAAIHDGYGSANTKFFDSGGPLPQGLPPENFGLSGRGEYKIIGGQDAWKEYNSLTAMGDKSELLVAGTGFDWTQAGSNDAVLWTVDAQYDNPNGLSAYGALLGQYSSIPGAGTGAPAGHYNSYGMLLQAGYMINANWEPFARWDFTHLDGALGSAAYGAEHNVHELTAGVNYYFYGQRAKMTIDGSWLPRGSPVDADGLGILKDDHHNELLARVQLQLAI